MATTIRWSAHRDSSKVGTVETLDDDHFAQRCVTTGLAVEAQPDEESESGDEAPAESDEPEPTPPRFSFRPAEPAEGDSE